jgi:hypothetical protein
MFGHTTDADITHSAVHLTQRLPLALSFAAMFAVGITFSPAAAASHEVVNGADTLTAATSENARPIVERSVRLDRASVERDESIIERPGRMERLYSPAPGRWNHTTDYGD